MILQFCVTFTKICAVLNLNSYGLENVIYLAGGVYWKNCA